MKHQLDQQEIDSYFQQAASVKDGAPAAVRFDFRRLDRIPKAQLTAIHRLHENFVRTLSSSLSVYLRSFVTGNLISLEQLPYSEFAEALQVPTCLVYFGMQPFEGYALLEASSSVVPTILDLILGGDGKNLQAATPREMTDVEQSLIEGFFQIVAHDLREAWKAIIDVDFKIASIETTPQSTGRFAATEAVVAIAIELKIGETVGMLNLAIPSITLKMMGQRFDQQWVVHKSTNPATELTIKKKLADQLNVTVDCQLSGMKIRLGDLLNLEPGQILGGASALDKGLEILVNGTTKFRASLASESGRRVAVIT